MEGVNTPAVVIWDLQNHPTAPRNVQWTTTSSPATNYYSHDAWTTTNLGTVFGLTLDNNGNIYVAATVVYGSKKVGSNSITPGVGGHGDIYRLDASTGTPTRFIQTVAGNKYSSGDSIPNTGPGLGNIHYSRVHDRLYVTNFEDGMIYCIRLNGTIQSLWNHGQNLTVPILDTETNGFTPLGRRPFAVQTDNGRLYYSIWWNSNGPSNAPQNEIWSVGLKANGDFNGPAQLEVPLPPFTLGNTVSSPVSDISFSPSGQMLLAERSMSSDVSVTAHVSRVLEYAWNGVKWSQPIPNKYKIGVWATQTNAAGGCDYDWGSAGLMWATSDAIHYPAPYIYGLQGTPTSGSPLDVTNSVLIDLDNDVTKVDKMLLGDVEIPCPKEGPTPPQEECSAVVKEISCKKGDDAGYTISLEVTNNSGQPAIDVLLATAPGSSYTVAPARGGPVADHASITIQVTITGGKPGDKACFTVTFMGEDGCLCTVEVCPVLPDCCAILSNEGTKVECNKDGTYTYTTTITNNSGSVKPFIYLYPPAGVTMTPDHFTMPAGGLAAGDVFQTPPITISGAKPGEFCFNISLHNKGMEGCCLSPRHCITLLPCDPQPKRPR